MIENGCVVAENHVIKVAQSCTDLIQISAARNQILPEILATLNGRISELRRFLKEFLGVLGISRSRVIELPQF